MTDATSVALITAISSVAAALIQSGAFQRKKAADHHAVVARHEPATQAPPVPAPTVAAPLSYQSTELPQRPALAGAPPRYGKVWVWFLIALCAEGIILPSLDDAVTALNLIILFPIATLGLAYWRPIHWSWAAVAVAVMYGSAYLGSALTETSIAGEEYDTEGDFDAVLFIYVLNAIAVSLVARYRMRKGQNI